MSNQNTYMLQAQAINNMLITDRRWLHAHAEVGMGLTDTVSYVEQQLREIGYDPITCGNGIVVLAGGKKPGKVFLIRADMDGLPIQEDLEVPYACRSGFMHACGHDLHTAMLLGAARLLKMHENEIEGVVKLMFQPAEETLEGANDMIKHGVLERPKVDAAMMIHVNTSSAEAAGTFKPSAPGISHASCDFFFVQVRGFGCHGSKPNLGIDPITTAAHILLALQQIHARELPITDRAVLTFGSISGGAAGNVIPNEVSMHGSLRTFDERTREFMKKRMVEITKNTASVFRAEAEVCFERGTPTVVNDYAMSADVTKYLREVVGEERVFCYPEGRNPIEPGSEDFGYVSHAVPSLMLTLEAGQKEKGYQFPLHHAKTAFDESVLPLGAAAYAYVATRWLAEHK